MSPEQDCVIQAARLGQRAMVAGQDYGAVLGYDERWPSGDLSGEWLASWLDGDPEIHRRGVLIHGARVLSDVDLSSLKLDVPIAFLQCQFGPNRIILDGARLAGLSLEGTHAGSLSCRGARLTGDLDCSDAVLTVSEERDTAVDLYRVTVEGDVVLSGVRTWGGIGINLARANVGGGLRMDRAKLNWAANLATNEEPSRLRPPALVADQSSIARAASLTPGFRAVGEVRFCSARVGAELNCKGAHLITPDYDAFSVDGADIGGTLWLSGDTCVVDGTVRTIRAVVNGDFVAQGTRFTRPLCGDSLVGDSVIIKRSARLERSKLEGTLRLAGAKVTGDVGLIDVRLCGGSVSLQADSIEVGGDLRLEKAEAAGLVSLRTASVNSSLACRHVSTAVDDGDNLDEELRADMRVRPVTIDATNSTVGHDLFLEDLALGGGGVVLHGVTTRVLRIDPIPNGAVDLEGLKYERLVTSGDEATPLHLLRLQPRPSPGPYRQLASMYRARGERSAAKRVEMARWNDRLRPPPQWRSHLRGGLGGRVERGWRWMLRVLVGHGFAPGRALVWAAGIVLGFALLLAVTISRDESGTYRPSVEDSRAVAGDCTSDYPCFSPLLYAMDTVVPLVDLGQRDSWIVDQSYTGDDWYQSGSLHSWISTLLQFLGWGIALLATAAVSGLLARE